MTKKSSSPLVVVIPIGIGLLVVFGVIAYRFVRHPGPVGTREGMSREIPALSAGSGAPSQGFSDVRQSPVSDLRKALDDASVTDTDDVSDLEQAAASL